ncbi:MAG TPA: type I pullulanase [Clostridia bacterium]|nr:type I pullulanase [Clostridia bacterium]
MIAIDGNFGNIYSPKGSTFKVWAPNRDDIRLLVYPYSQGVYREEFPMEKCGQGIHSITINKDLKGMYYTYLIEGKYEITDPYSKALSVNSTRSAIIDLADSHPKGWLHHKIPKSGDLSKAVIYELHIKDFTYHDSSGVEYPGKYLGLAQRGTSFNDYSTGLDHLLELGVTHVQLMPIFDFLTVNEEESAFNVDENYNWGYDPEHYNVPEGSYATDPPNPINRIKELKSLILALHQAGIKVIMDVVYNHSYRNTDSNLYTLHPGYYRIREDGSLSDGSGCGNELATEHPMTEKFIIDSLKYWVEEYKVDGFRFDLMALIDIDTVMEIQKELMAINKDIIIYGEPWAADTTLLSQNRTTTKGSQRGKGFGLFNDDFRNAIKGDNNGYIKGFSQGNSDYLLQVETGIAGSINYDNKHIGFTKNPRESINYINSHDNLILQDKMKKIFPSTPDDELIRYNKLALAILFTSQGVPFIHAGNEFLRTKSLHHNSYNLPISINAIDWSLKEIHYPLFKYTRDLIYIKKHWEEFSLRDSGEVREKLRFLYFREQNNLIAYTIKSPNGDYLLIIHNGNHQEFVLETTLIMDHIKNNYNEDIKNLYINHLFNKGGLIDPMNKSFTDNIILEPISTNIYRVGDKG